MTSNTDEPFDRQLGQPDETVRLLAQGLKVFKRYLLIRIVGRGGMGVVWLAHDDELDRNVALKFLPEAICHDQEATAELKRETRRSLELTHPNIVRIYDFVHDEERAAIAMEYIDGKTLSALKVEEPDSCFEVRQIAPWVHQLCTALDYAHNVARVVHQDLKPANLMIDAKGQLKITDFGIARSIADSVTRITAEDMVGGTLVYMSPQQLNGEKPSPTNDLYSLGATIYDLLTSKPPFYTGLLHQQIENKPPMSMAARRTELEISGEPIPDSWETCIAACLAKTPQERPTGALEVAARLGLHRSETETGRANGHATGSEPSKTRKRIALVAGALLVVAMLAASILFRSGRQDLNNGSPPSAAIGGKGQHSAKTPAVLPPVVIKPLPRMTNSLGMVFVKLDDLLVCIWETRVRDFKAFVGATGYDAKRGVQSKAPAGTFADFGLNWENPGWEQTPNSPVVGVSREDGHAFCAWLTEADRKAGVLTNDLVYRLPTDREWSVFADFAQETGATPTGRDLRHRDAFPWGKGWPPPPGVGNYGAMEGRDDGCKYTAPVGAFRPNRFGIFDLGGNVWEWCEDAFEGTFDPAHPEGTLRGASYLTMLEDQVSLSRRKWPNRQINTRNAEFGFRVVLGARKPPPASPDKLGPRLTNSLGMVFARVGPLYFSVWETRVQDFTAFAGTTKHIPKGTLQAVSSAGHYAPKPGADWRNPGFPQSPLHPVVGVCRADAEAFCEWLTAKARTEGNLPAGFIYRLPTDCEWSRAAGLKREPGDTPETRNGKAAEVYPWGNAWPPPAKAGNYRVAGSEIKATAPVAGFAPNQFGLYDLGGNVWEWCEDGFGRFNLAGVLRGASFLDDSREVLSSSHRRNPHLSAVDRLDAAVGFRCVLAPEFGGIMTASP